MTTRSPEHVAEIQRVGHATLTALMRAQTGFEGDKGWINPDLSIEVLTILLAGLIEMIPEHGTPRDLRLAVESTSTLLKRTARSFREDFERTGEHGIAEFGGIGTPPDQIPKA